MKTHNPSKSILLTALFLLMAGSLSRAADTPQEQMNILQTIIHGGPLIISIWVCIIGTSIALIAFIIQLVFILRVESLAPQSLVDSLANSISAGNYQQAWEVCRSNKAYIAKVLGETIERIGRGKDAFETALIERGMREAQIIKTKISYISVIGVIAPMIGLLGTVIGMMGAFAVLGSSGVADPRGLSLRIGEVLMATASGLFIAIPAFIFYYYFRNLATIVFVAADDKLTRLTEDIPFEELGGVRIGVGADGAIRSKPEFPGTTKSVVLDEEAPQDIPCPVCQGTLTVGQSPCPHCGASIDWA